MELDMKNLVTGLVVMGFLGGCASKEYVHEYVQGQLKPVQERTNNLDTRLGNAESTQRASAAGVESIQRKLDETIITLKVHADRLAKNEADIAQISRTAQDALDRAMAAGKLAEGKMAYEVVLSEDKVKFPAGKAALNKQAMEALDAFAAQLKSEGRGVYVEVQGHTDSRGEQAANQRLGQQRADAVRDYLHRKGGLPLHRLASVSYGEDQPAHSNLNRDGRAKNRRVVLVVLR